MKNKIVTIVFCLMIASGVIALILVPDRYYSESEKRTLTQLPHFSLNDLKSGKLGDSIEKYLADQFPARDTFVAIKTVTDRLGGKKESNGVYYCRDGYLIEAHKSLPQKQTLKNLEGLKALSDYLAANNLPCYAMLVPTSCFVLSDKLPEFAPNADQRAVMEYAKKQGINNIIDTTDILKEHKNEYIYYKTDHHWTGLGAYYAYCEWMTSKGLTPEPASAWKSSALCDDFRGTTYSKINYPFASYDRIDAYYKEEKHAVSYNDGAYKTDTIYEKKYLNGSDKYAVFFNSNQATTKIAGKGTGRLLIIKDSYANTFAQFVVDDYEETHLIDLRFFKGDLKKYIQENGITEVLVLYNIPNFCEDTYFYAYLSRCLGLH